MQLRQLKRRVEARIPQPCIRDGFGGPETKARRLCGVYLGSWLLRLMVVAVAQLKRDHPELALTAIDEAMPGAILDSF